MKSAPVLPSLIQKIVDLDKERKFHLVLCGSAQQMMQGLILDSSAPLYGRADEILKIAPLEAGWITDALNCQPSQAVTEFSVWGGIPRYWELRAEEDSFEEAVMNVAAADEDPMDIQPFIDYMTPEELHQFLEDWDDLYAEYYDLMAAEGE